jgi:ElaB/YqjD/DUF883 family membrane-anchored ribosome-binding protein
MSTNRTDGEAQGSTHTIAEQVRTLSEQAAERADEGIHRASTVAAHAADALRGGAERTQHATETAADKLEKASEYMHDADSPTLVQDATRFVRKHPLQTVVAVIGAFILARLIF